MIEKIQECEKIIKELEHTNTDQNLQNQNLLLSEENIVFNSTINELKTEIVQSKAKLNESENKSNKQSPAKKLSPHKHRDDKYSPYTHYQLASPSYS